MIGLIYMLLLSEEYGQIDPQFTRQFAQFVHQNGYPLEALNEYSFEALKGYLVKDKKADYGELHFVLLNEIAKPYMQIVPLSTCEAYDQKLRQLVAEVLV